MEAPKIRKKYREFGLRPPRALQHFCRELGGTNIYGGPMYRLSWAPSQLAWMAGKWLNADKNGNFISFDIFAQRGLKYPQLGERFILENWKAPEYYGSEEAWVQSTRQMEEDGQILDKLGPYPREGDYEMCFHFQDSEGGFVHPNKTIIERRIQEHMRIVKKRSFLLAMAKEARDYEEFAKKREQSDILSEAFDGLNGLITPYVSLSGIDVPPAAPAAISTTQEVP